MHGSDSEEQAQKEIEYFFPMEQTIAVIKPDAYGTKGNMVALNHPWRCCEIYLRQLKNAKNVANIKNKHNDWLYSSPSNSYFLSF